MPCSDESNSFEEPSFHNKDNLLSAFWIESVEDITARVLLLVTEERSLLFNEDLEELKTCNHL